MPYAVTPGQLTSSIWLRPLRRKRGLQRWAASGGVATGVFPAGFRLFVCGVFGAESVESGRDFGSAPCISHKPRRLGLSVRSTRAMPALAPGQAEETARNRKHQQVAAKTCSTRQRTARWVRVAAASPRLWIPNAPQRDFVPSPVGFSGGTIRLRPRRLLGCRRGGRAVRRNEPVLTRQPARSPCGRGARWDPDSSAFVGARQRRCQPRNPRRTVRDCPSPAGRGQDNINRDHTTAVRCVGRERCVGSGSPSTSRFSSFCGRLPCARTKPRRTGCSWRR